MTLAGALIAAATAGYFSLRGDIADLGTSLRAENAALETSLCADMASLEESRGLSCESSGPSSTWLPWITTSGSLVSIPPIPIPPTASPNRGLSKSDIPLAAGRRVP